MLIAESDLNDPRLVHSPAQGGYGLDAHWEDDFHHALHRVMTGETSGYYMDFNGIQDLATSVRDGYIYQGQYSAHRKRRHGRPPLGVRPEQLVVSAQNHDQIGNRARGERLSMLLNPLQLKAVAALTILSPFVPLLFQGEEWGATTPFLYFTDHQDEALGRLVAQGRRREFESFGWQDAVPDPQAPATFSASQLNWEELEQPAHHGLLDWYRQVIALKAGAIRPQSHAARVSCDEASGWLALVVGDLCVAVNFASKPVALTLPDGNWRVLLTSREHPLDASQLAPYETRIHIQSL